MARLEWRNATTPEEIMDLRLRQQVDHPWLVAAAGPDEPLVEIQDPVMVGLLLLEERLKLLDGVWPWPVLRPVAMWGDEVFEYRKPQRLQGGGDIVLKGHEVHPALGAHLTASRAGRESVLP
jgi:hypothetical protein